jgi:hypothetical protein
LDIHLPLKVIKVIVSFIPLMVRSSVKTNSSDFQWVAKETLTTIQPVSSNRHTTNSHIGAGLLASKAFDRKTFKP